MKIKNLLREHLVPPCYKKLKPKQKQFLRLGCAALALTLSLTLVLGLLPGMNLTAKAAAAEPTYKIQVKDISYNDTKLLVKDTTLPYQTTGSKLKALQGYNTTVVKIVKKSGDNVTISGTNITITGAGTSNVWIYRTSNSYVNFEIIVTKNITASATGYDGSYDGQDHGISVNVSIPASGATVKYGTKSGTYNLTESPKYKDAGNYTVYYQVTADDYNTKTGSAQVKIAKLTPSITAAPMASAITYGQTLANSTLTGGAASVAGSFAWKEPSTSPAVANSNSTEYTVVFTPNDTTNYNTAECKVKLTVNRANQTVTAPAAVSGLVYDGSAQTLVTAATVTAGNTASGSISYSLDNASWSTSLPQGTNAGNYTVYYKVAGNDNYNEFVCSVPVSVTITKADPETPTGLAATFGQTLADVTLPEGWTWADSSQSVGAAGENTFKANFAGNDNYNSASNVDVTVTVSTIAVTGVTLDKTSLTLNEGDDPVTLTATVTPSNATNKGVTWSVAPEGVVTVADGVVTAVAPGTATVTVTTDDGGKTATCAVTVNPGINVNAGGGKTHRIKKDGALYFTFVYVGHDADTYQAFVDADKVVTVSGENYTKQLMEGTEFNAKSGSLKLTLTRNYLDFLKPGDYTVTAKFRINGSVYESSSTFKIASSDGNNPGTGEDMMLIGAAMILFILSLSVLAYMAYTDKPFRAKLLAVPAGITSFFTRSDAGLNEKKDGSEDNEA